MTDKQKLAVAETLHPLLIDALELRNHAKLAHWNLKDPAFIALHRYFDEVAASAITASDEIAERIRQLDAEVLASTKEVGSQTALSGFPKGLVKGKEAVTALVNDLENISKALYEAIEKCEDQKDPISADLLTGICGQADLHHYFLKSHLT